MSTDNMHLPEGHWSPRVTSRVGPSAKILVFMGDGDDALTPFTTTKNQLTPAQLLALPKTVYVEAQ